MPDSLKSLFNLDPDIIFLNHGSFGACPQPVFAVYQEWQRRLERQPVLFLGRELPGLMQAARRSLGDYLNAASDDLVFVPNATHGVNIVARSLNLQPGDEILTSDHEYGACDYTWEFICGKSAAKYIRQPLPLPLGSEQDFLETLWRRVTPRTRLIFLSHITSPTAQQFPVAAVCQRARQAGILTLVDGAHAPGQIDLDLPSIGADFYTGNCHKWMLSPKGAAFLYTRREAQPLIEPLVVSWGYHASGATSSGSRYVDILEWTGTRDVSAALSVPAAIRFMAEHDWPRVRAECHTLLRSALSRLSELTGQPPLLPLDSTSYHQLGAAALPAETDLVRLKEQLYDHYHIEVPLVDWNGHKLIRISVQGYNTSQDIDALLHALKKCLPL